MRILGIPGSLRRGSFNRRLLQAAARELPAGAKLTVWDGLAAVPPFNEDDEDGPAHPAVADLRTSIGAADAVLIATPEYNGSLPGQLKNALDWASRPRGSAVLEGKPVATVSASPTPYGAAWAQQNLRKVLNVIGAEVTGGELAVPQAFQQFGEDGRLADPELSGRLTDLVTELAARILIEPAGGVVTLAGTAGLATLGAEPHPADLAWRLALMGMGHGPFAGPNSAAILAATPRDMVATAGGVTALFRTLGFTLGPAIGAMSWSFAGGGAAGFRTGALALLVAAAGVLAATLATRGRAARVPASSPQPRGVDPAG